ncbi:MAG: hypothetical protein E7672_03615 [Ruminococcaceae bacterium]|nr:hypothetical protein [Oscillospiraceae bacterium]
MNNKDTNITPENMKKKGGLNKKYLKIGSFSITMTAVVIAVVVLINLFVCEVPTIYTKFDLSSESLYSISGETEAILAGSDEEVTFYILSQKGYEDETIIELLGRYAALNSKINVKTVDPTTNPTFIEKYTSESLSPNSVIAESAKRHYVIDYYEIFVTEYSEEELFYYYYYGQMPTGTPYFCGELKFTTAYDYVTRDDLPTTYILSGHGETALGETTLSYITAENIGIVSDYSLLTVDSLPEDCASVIINNPTSDISSDELNKLKSYIDDGGNIILITGALSYSSATMPNIASLAKHMGLEALDGIVIETNRNNYTMYPFTLLPKLGSTNEGPLSLISNTNIYVLADRSHGIVSDGTKDVIPLLSTSSGSYVTSIAGETLEKKEGDYEGSVFVGAAVEGENDSKFVWFSSAALSDQNADSYVSGGNSAVFMSTLNWMSENETSISIMAKQLSSEALTVTASQAGLWSVIVVFVIPLSVIVLGFVVWIRRRKK